MRDSSTLEPWQILEHLAALGIRYTTSNGLLVCSGGAHNYPMPEWIQEAIRNNKEALVVLVLDEED